MLQQCYVVDYVPPINEMYIFNSGVSKH